MKIIDLYARELIDYADNFHFAILDKDDRKKLCSRLRISQERLEEVVEFCLKKRYMAFAPIKEYPYFIGPTDRGLAAFGFETWGGHHDS
jgi:hypothetical protein